MAIVNENIHNKYIDVFECNLIKQCNTAARNMKVAMHANKKQPHLYLETKIYWGLQLSQ